ncbi:MULTISPECIES: SAF domain-containing protein [Serinicoccus]|uniref:SAF domain-containing protein n=1 Tax=Serinicoccus TaxID=265976 RepID=UPI0009FA6805|nr:MULTISPECIES: SAF domain-containing protein [Serinicoccus]
MTRRAARSGTSSRRELARVLRHPVLRRWLAAALAAITVGGSLHLVLTRPQPDEVPVVVAARQLAVGTTLSARDTELRHVPPDLLPEGFLSAAPEVGASLAVPVQAGEVLTTADLRTSALLDGLEGEVAVWLPVTDAAVATATVAGDRIDVHSPVDGDRVARGALVLRPGTGEEPGLWVAVDEGTAGDLAAARGADPLGAALLVAVRATGG